uniref:Uncharacterized protein n=1 Tax=Petromyzon marinus TaxID=7757 RepID=S4R6N2_PETMA
ENYILIDLAKNKDFKEFDEYIHHPKQHFQKYITECVEEYCKENDNEIIHDMLKSSLEGYTADITRAINKATEIVRDNEYDASSWLDVFCTQLDDAIKLPRHTLNKGDYSEITDWQLCGCWVQCPSCKAICTNTMSNHDGDHSVPIHRPKAIVFPDRKIPWKDYRTAGPNYACWSITPDLTTQPYWKWFVCTFKSDLEKRYNLK